MSKTFHAAIYTPKSIFLDKNIVEINIEIANGYIGILADHVPLISAIQTCQFSISNEKNKKQNGIIESGILHFENNELKVFTTNVIWVENINKENAKSEIDKLNKSLKQDNVNEYQLKTINKKIKYYKLQL